MILLDEQTDSNIDWFIDSDYDLIYDNDDDDDDDDIETQTIIPWIMHCIVLYVLYCIPCYAIHWSVDSTWFIPWFSMIHFVWIYPIGNVTHMIMHVRLTTLVVAHIYLVRNIPIFAASNGCIFSHARTHTHTRWWRSRNIDWCERCGGDTHHDEKEVVLMWKMLSFLKWRRAHLKTKTTLLHHIP